MGILASNILSRGREEKVTMRRFGVDKPRKIGWRPGAFFEGGDGAA